MSNNVNQDVRAEQNLKIEQLWKENQELRQALAASDALLTALVEHFNLDIDKAKCELTIYAEAKLMTDNIFRQAGVV
jgi:hypothetical protein